MHCLVLSMKGTGGCQSCVPSNCNLLEALHIISDSKLYMQPLQGRESYKATSSGDLDATTVWETQVSCYICSIMVNLVWTVTSLHVGLDKLVEELQRQKINNAAVCSHHWKIIPGKIHKLLVVTMLTYIKSLLYEYFNFFIGWDLDGITY